jgi:hypothetical protein
MEQFRDEDLDMFIDLGRSDSNQSMFADVLVQTLRIAALRLTQAQWERVVTELGTFDGARGIVERTRLLRRLASERLSKDLMRACVDNNDREIHEYVLGHPGFERWVFVLLSEHGATRSVRNRSAQMARKLQSD